MPRRGCACVDGHLPDTLLGERRPWIQRGLLEHALDVRKLRLESRNRLPERSQAFEQPHDIRADAGRRAEVDDLHGDPAADAVEPADPLLHNRWIPRQVVQHETMAELEVAPLAACFGRYENARPVRCAEARDLHVPAGGGQLLVEGAAGDLRAIAERRSQHLERLAMRDEHERLLIGSSPAPGLRQQPLHPRIDRVSGSSVLPQLLLVWRKHCSERRTGRERATDPIELPAFGNRMCRGCRPHRHLELATSFPPGGSLRRYRDRRSRRESADIETPRRARARGQRRAGGEPRLEIHVRRELVRPQQLQQPEEPARVIFERRRAEQQHVAG
jgi:hypothetical protein